MKEECKECDRYDSHNHNHTHTELFRVMHAFKRLNFGTILPGDITHAEWGILSMTYVCKSESGREQMTVSDIVNHMRVAAPAVSRSLKSLEEKDLIVRTVDKKDRRNTYVSLTPKGLKLVKEGETIMHDFADAVFGGLGEENMEHLVAYMKEILELSEKEIAKRKYKSRKDEAENEKDI